MEAWLFCVLPAEGEEVRRTRLGDWLARLFAPPAP